MTQEAKREAQASLTIQEIPQKAIEDVCFRALGLVDRNREYLEQHLQQAGPDPEAAQALADIASASSQMERALGELMDLLDCLRGQPEPVLRPVDLCELLKGVLDIAAPVLHARGIELTLDCPAEPEKGWVLADWDRAVQVCLHLLSNALHACGKGGHVQLALSGGAERWLLTITDDGGGLKEQGSEEERLECRRRFLGGARAGLLLCREYCRRMDWTLELVDRPEGGAQARLSIPARPEQRPPARTVELHAEDDWTRADRFYLLRQFLLRDLRTLPGSEKTLRKY